MEQKHAEKIILDCLQPIYGFVLKKTRTMEDAEDLSQEIALKSYRALLGGSPEDPTAFVWRVARNELANYYRSKARSSIGIPIDDLSETLESEDEDIADVISARESCGRIQREIAYLSKLQRAIIIAYYYDGKKVGEIAKDMQISDGTVKWHLFEARSNLKKGMETMRKSSDLKFNPIIFSIMGVNGSTGTMGGTSKFLRSTLSQNISYAVYHEAKTVAQIADDLGVSPVYVESEAEFLEEYGFLTKTGNKYLTNFIIEEGSEEILRVQDEMYTNAARLISFELLEELKNSSLLNSPSLYFPDGDKNFLVWGLLLYLLAWSNDGGEGKIKFDEVATLRPDGGKYIAYAGVASGLKQKYFDSILKWCGPMWNEDDNILLWQIDSEWSARDNNFNEYQNAARRDMKLLHRFTSGEQLSKDEYAHLAQRGYIRGSGGNFELAVIWLKDKEIKDKLLDLSLELKRKHAPALAELKEKFIAINLADTPKQVHKMKAFGMQYIFHADGWFLLYTVKELLVSGKLQLPTEEQRRSLSTVIMTGK